MHRWLALSLLFLLGCKRTQIDNSAVDYGFSTQLVNLSLFHLGPDKAVTVCDRGSAGATVTDNIGRAVKEWADTINRGGRITVRKACTQNAGDALIGVTIGSTGSCGAGAAGCTVSSRPLAYELYFPNAAMATYDAILHEIGHVWGNCDRYTASTLHTPAFGSNCNGKTNNKAVASAMQALSQNSPHRVTEDDAEGMRAMAEDLSIGANSSWKMTAGSSPGAPAAMPGTTPSAIPTPADDLSFGGRPAPPSPPGPAAQPAGGGAGQWCDAYTSQCFPYCTNGQETVPGWGWQPE